MKAEDFEILKNVIEKEGFEFHVTDQDKNQVIMIIQKKDIWEGVRYVYISSIGIRKISLIEDFLIYFREIECDREFGVIKKNQCKPSTETAYIEQLEKYLNDKQKQK